VKYLLWALLLYLGWRWYLSKKEAPKADSTAAAPPAPETPDTAEKMVACAFCGIHLPLSESVAGSGALHYCSDAHRLQHSTR
jgi:uncharacterized protein